MRTETLCVIVCSGFVEMTDKASLFLLDDDVVFVPPSATMIDLLTSPLGLPVFPSRGQARKNLKDIEIPFGWSEHEIGKFRHRLFIWKPSALSSAY